MMSIELKLKYKENYKRYKKYYTGYNILNRERIRERNQKKKEHIKNVKRKWYLNNKESIQRQQKMYRANR
jgi:hypothetical protein